MLTKKAEAAVKTYLRTTDPRDVAYASVVGRCEGGVGPYRIFPLLAYVKEEFGHKFLTLSCIMLRMVGDKHVGVLGWNIPLNERTLKQACGLLTSLGWDGRAWPLDPGWPDDSEEAAGLRVMLTDAKVFATFTFPPSPKGSIVIQVNVLKLASNFPLPPILAEGSYLEPTKEQLEAFAKFVAQPDLFV